MELFEAIVNRRSIGRLKPDLVEREKIERILEMATWAPNHHHTEPWKFFVLTGEGRKPLGAALAKITGDEAQAQKPFRAPVVIAVAVTPSKDDKVIEIEETAAVCAAIQNMLLTAHALGLAAIWRTGKPTYHPEMKKLFGLKMEQSLLGFVYVGYPDMAAPKSKRISFAEKTVWISEAP